MKDKVTSNGQVSFISDLWGGKVLDKHITRESGVVHFYEPNDNVLVDSGYDISNIMPNGSTLSMPPTTTGKN